MLKTHLDIGGELVRGRQAPLPGIFLIACF
jgi:hypothetical protein